MPLRSQSWGGGCTPCSYVHVSVPTGHHRLGGQIRPPPLLSRKPMVAASRVRRQSKVLGLVGVSPKSTYRPKSVNSRAKSGLGPSLSKLTQYLKFAFTWQMLPFSSIDPFWPLPNWLDPPVTSGTKTVELRSNLIEKRHRGIKRALRYFWFNSYHI